MCLCKCLSAFCNCICNFRRLLGFSRAVDAAERNDRSGSIVEGFGKGVGGFREKESVVKLEGEGSGYQHR